MTELALLLLAAAAGYGLAQWARLPLLPLLLLAGAVLARAGAALTPETTRQVLELGLAFLVFAAGVELNPRRFTAQLRAVVPVALLQFLVVGGMAWFVLTRLSVPPLAAVYLAAAAASSSTLGALRELRRQRKSFEPFGRLVTGVLLVQDFLMVGVIMVLAALAADGLAMGAGLLRATLLLAGAWAAQRWVIPRWSCCLRPWASPRNWACRWWWAPSWPGSCCRRFPPADWCAASSRHWPSFFKPCCS
jgi:Kef-type K+ transport system membrane component KefB